VKYTILSVIFFLIAWKVAGHITPAIILPAPEVVIINIYQLLADGILLESLWITALRVFAGFLSGMLIGAGAGFLAGISKNFYRFTKPYVAMMQSIPRLSWILIATFWFGLTPAVVVFLVTITVLPYFYVNVSESVKYTDKQMLEVAKIYNISPFRRFTDIYLPAAMGSIMSASSMALSISWKAVIMAELLSVPTGLGAEMSIAQSNIDMAGILAYTLVVALIAWGSNVLLTYSFDRYFKRWKA
jgi:NitT/TauT family transport system permease protein